MTELYVGNLLYEVTIAELRALFSPYGTPYLVDLFTEPGPDKPHAYAFVEMENDEARVAIQALDGTDFMGLTLRVEEAQGEHVS